MSYYKHILFATDFSDHAESLIDKVRYLAKDNQACLSIVHVLNHLAMTDAAYGPIIPLEGEFMDQFYKAALSKLNGLADQLEIAESKRWLETGDPKMEIVRIAEENSVDLIVLGSHGRHGLALLLGSTANGVLHHAKCDVLAVRLHD